MVFFGLFSALFLSFLFLVSLVSVFAASVVTVSPQLRGVHVLEQGQHRAE